MSEERLDHRFSHEWHVAINQFHDGKIGSPDWRRWMYEAKTMADEVPRMTMLFKRERDGLLKSVHTQCSRSESVHGENVYTLQLRAFIKTIRGEASLNTDPKDAIGNMRLIDAIYEKAGLKKRGT